MARAARGAFDDVVVGPIVLKKVQIHGGELAQRRSEVSHQTDRFEKYFRQENRGADVPVTPAIVQPTQQQGQALKVGIGGLPQDCSIGAGMHMNRIRPNGHVYCDRDLIGMGSRQETVGLVGILPLGDSLAQSCPHADLRASVRL